MKFTANIFYLIFGFIFGLLFNYFYLNQSSSSWSFYDKKKSWITDFYKIGREEGTNKVSTYSYHYMYGAYLGPLRNQHVNFLEIGLGCGMPYGPGRSIDVWKRYFYNNIRLTILEYVKPCAEKFKESVDNMVIGDQSKKEVLEEVGKYGLFDVIVDDGGHMRNQQMASLIGLWKYVKPGGVYIMEDTAMSFISKYNNYDVSPYDFVIDNLKQFFDPKQIHFKSMFEIPSNSVLDEFHSTLLSIDCFQGACVFIKKQ